MDSFLRILDLKSEYKYKPDKELKQIITNNATKAIATQKLDQLQFIADESKACEELLSARKKAAAEAPANWNASLPSWQESAILNLKTAASPNGQLVAAILDDGRGRSAKSIRSLCEKIAGLSAEDTNTLLSNLEHENIIEKHEDGKYYLINLCTEDLFQPDRFERASRAVALAYGSGDLYRNIAQIVLKDLATSRRGKTQDEIYILVRTDGGVDSEFCNLELPWEITAALDNLCYRKIISSFTPIGSAESSEPFFYFPMLGYNGG